MTLQDVVHAVSVKSTTEIAHVVSAILNMHIRIQRN